MRIWLIQTGEPLPLNKKIRKMRTSILADKLVEQGHDVLWWASAFDHLKKEWVFDKDTEFQLQNGVEIKALKGKRYKKNISFARFIGHRIIARKFRKFAPETPKPDIIIASTPAYDLAYEAVLYAKRNNIPVLVDIRDEWPDIFLDHISPKFHVFAKVLLYKEFKMIKKVMRLADGLVAVTTTFLEWGLRYAEREKNWKDKLFHIGYRKDKFPDKNCANKMLEIKDKLKGKFVVGYLGTFNIYHNPLILVDCASRLVDCDDIYFILAGSGGYFDEAKKKAGSLPNIILPGWLNQYEITTFLECSQIAVCPTPQSNILFPNKAFAYLSAGLPILSAFRGEIKEVIERYQVGFYYPPNDVDTLVGCIKKLYDNPDLCKRMSENALKIFHEKFDADKIYGEYIEHIERIAKEQNSTERYNNIK